MIVTVSCSIPRSVCLSPYGCCRNIQVAVACRNCCPLAPTKQTAWTEQVWAASVEFSRSGCKLLIWAVWSNSLQITDSSPREFKWYAHNLAKSSSFHLEMGEENRAAQAANPLGLYGKKFGDPCIYPILHSCAALNQYLAFRRSHSLFIWQRNSSSGQTDFAWSEWWLISCLHRIQKCVWGRDSVCKVSLLLLFKEQGQDAVFTHC